MSNLSCYNLDSDRTLKVGSIIYFFGLQNIPVSQTYVVVKLERVQIDGGIEVHYKNTFHTVKVSLLDALLKQEGTAAQQWMLSDPQWNYPAAEHVVAANQIYIVGQTTVQERTVVSYKFGDIQD